MFPGFWAVPGGHVEAGETIRQAIWGETFEETGLIVNKILVEFKEMHWKSYCGQPYVQMNFVVTVKESSSIPLDSEEHSEWQWMDQKESMSLPMSKEMAEAVASPFKIAKLELSTQEWTVDTTGCNLRRRGRMQ